MKLVLISDTHGKHRQLELPAGDMLIHAGDISRHGEMDTIQDFNDWLAELPFKYKVVIAGNHDFCFETLVGQKLLTNATYLQDSAIVIEGLKIYGSPWQPRFFDWAFNLDRGDPLKAKWQEIPADTDILITHGPPWGVGDTTNRGVLAGCQDLLERIQEISPKLHVFGHIHEGYGLYQNTPTIFANASTCNLGYQPINLPIVIDL